eukprot:CAMPEP_0113658996 /NCGR_PEP_ID=MMETSP0017_2-20120614/32081_1 /TAXON_ID=2856 /ORGANISM="Cylindrotheca closterium" /LENGTH=327 /DNA_ID=CAMNT_0000573435 /DNA_START=146 /DNA_END=1129 /DNA_ORIENTATION=+ /assembly_acc=CAM_ASM_000147
MPPPVDISEIHTVYHQEITKYRTCDYIPRLQQEYSQRQAQQQQLAGNPGIVPQSPANATEGAINQQWREKICEWEYQVVDHFHLKREIVSVAMNYLDRCLATSPAVDKSSFQLLAMTCLYVSIKLNHHTHLLIPGSNSTLQSLLELSRGFFSTKDLEKKELELLRRLEWQVHPPTPQYFLESFHAMFLEALEQRHLQELHHTHDMSMDEDPSDKREVLELAHFLVELATMDYFFVLYLPSQVALASLVTAVRRLNPDPQTDPSVLLPGFEDSQELRACCNRMARLYDRILSEDSASSGRRMPGGTTTPNSTSTTPGSDSPVSVRMDT